MIKYFLIFFSCLLFACCNEENPIEKYLNFSMDLSTPEYIISQKFNNYIEQNKSIEFD